MKTETVLLWDRKAEGGFPETKVLKQRVRDRIDPSRDLGHSDVGGKKAKKADSGVQEAGEDVTAEKKAESDDKTEGNAKAGEVCEDCK